MTEIKITMREVLEKNIMIVATFFVSGAFIAGKFSVREFPIYSLIFLRFLIATITLFAIIKGLKKDIRIDKKELPIITLLSLLGMVGYHIFFFNALKLTSSLNTSLIAAVNPIITTTLTIIFLREPITKKGFLGILISFIGVIFIITNGSFTVLRNLDFNLGDLLMVCGVFFFASYFVILSKVLKRVEPMILTFYVFFICALILLPVIFYENPMEFLPNISLKAWGSLFYMSIFASVGSYLMQQISVKRIGPAKTSLYINLIPVFSMFMAYFILGEKVTPQKILATTMIISGVFITNRQKIKKEI